MGANLRRPGAVFPPPTQADIDIAWSTVRQLEREGNLGQAQALARVVYAVDRVREAMGQPTTQDKEQA